MQSYPTKTDGVSVEPAAEYNNLASELKSTVTSLGITLDSGSIIQLAEVIQIYSLIGKYYTDSGAADAYVLTADPVTRISPTIYYDGMEVSWLPAFSNTGASTINLAGLGVKSVVKNDGATALNALDIVANKFSRATYDGTNFRLFEVDTVSGGSVGFDSTFDGTVASNATTIPDDDTVPQIGEGSEYMSLVYTPKSASNMLVIDALGNFAISGGFIVTAAIFQDAIANALRTGRNHTDIVQMFPVSVKHTMVAGTTSPITFRFRAAGTTGTTTFNGVAAAQKNGGNLSSYMTVTEYVA